MKDELGIGQTFGDLALFFRHKKEELKGVAGAPQSRYAEKSSTISSIRAGNVTMNGEFGLAHAITDYFGS